MDDYEAGRRAWHANQAGEFTPPPCMSMEWWSGWYTEAGHAALVRARSTDDPAAYVPTGYVPRRDHYAEALERGKRVGEWADSIRAPAAPYTGPIAQAVDDYLLMERKARAWDAAVAALAKDVVPGMRVDLSLLDLMREAVQSAQPSAPADR